MPTDDHTIIRGATAADSAQIVELIALLDHQVDSARVAQRIADLSERGIPQLVAVQGNRIVGVCVFIA